MDTQGLGFCEEFGQSRDGLRRAEGLRGDDPGLRRLLDLDLRLLSGEGLRLLAVWMHACCLMCVVVARNVDGRLLSVIEPSLELILLHDAL